MHTKHITGVVCSPEIDCDAVRCQSSRKVEREEEVELEEGATRKYPEKCPECGVGWMSRKVPWQHKETCSKYPSGVTASNPDDLDDDDIDDDDDIEDDDLDDEIDDLDDEWDIEEGDLEDIED